MTHTWLSDMTHTCLKHMMHSAEPTNRSHPIFKSFETRSRLEYQIWRIHIWSIFEADDAFTCKAWHIHLWDMTHFYTRHDTSIHQTWRIHKCSMTHSYMREEAFTCKAWHIHLWDMTHFYTRHDTSIHQTCFTCPTQSIMYVPLQVNRFQKIVLLIVQYKYLKSCSRRFNSPESDPPHKIMRYDVYSSPQLCCWFPRQKSVRWKWFVLAVYHVLKRHFGGAGP